jgi:hypothetical protein
MFTSRKGTPLYYLKAKQGQVEMVLRFRVVCCELLNHAIVPVSVHTPIMAEGTSMNPSLQHIPEMHPGPH